MVDHVIVMLLLVSLMIMGLSFYFEKKFLRKHQEMLLVMNRKLAHLDSRQEYIEQQVQRLEKELRKLTPTSQD